MGSVAAVLERDGGGGRLEAVRSMLLAAPHRGARMGVVVQGDCALGASCRPDFVDAHVAQGRGLGVAFTGMLDNARELAVELGWPGSEADGPNPAEIVLAAFERWGESAVSRFRGVFAGVASDGVSAWAFRDHLGFRSLFYRVEAGRMIAATEAKQVVAGARIPLEPDLDVLQKVFWSLLDDDTPSSLRGVSRLPKATQLVVTPSRVATARYWRPEKVLETGRLSAVDVRDRFLELFGQGVERSLGTDPVVSRSGGVDSPAVAAFAAPVHRARTGRRFPALSVVYPNHPRVDETRYIRPVVGALDLDWHTYEQRTSATEGLVDWTALADGPVAITGLSECAEDYRTARHLGFRTILTGELAEYVVERRRYLVSHLMLSGRYRAAAGQLRAQRARGVGLLGLGRQLVTPLVPAPVMAAYTRLRRDSFGRLPEWVDRSMGRRMHTRNEVPPAERWISEQLVGFIGPSPGLEAEEVCQAVSGVAVRRPWADVDLWEFFLSLPAEVKFPDATTKSLVRSLLRGKVPDLILDRTDKTYFTESLMARIDYAALRRSLLDTDTRIEGVDYARLAAHLEREDLDILGFHWAKDLASVHAFLSLWDGVPHEEAS